MSILLSMCNCISSVFCCHKLDKIKIFSLNIIENKTEFSFIFIFKIKIIVCKRKNIVRDINVFYIFIYFID